MFREIGGAFVDIDKLHQFRVEMGISERAIGHEGVVEMSGIVRISFECEKTVNLRLFTG